MESRSARVSNNTGRAISIYSYSVVFYFMMLDFPFSTVSLLFIGWGASLAGRAAGAKPYTFRN